MNVYLISQYSDCGTYFQPYLKSVTVIANNEGEALKLCQQWQKENNEKFIYKREPDIELLGPAIQCVIDVEIDTDY